MPLESTTVDDAVVVPLVGAAVTLTVLVGDVSRLESLVRRPCWSAACEVVVVVPTVVVLVEVVVAWPEEPAR